MREFTDLEDLRAEFVPWVISVDSEPPEEGVQRSIRVLACRTCAALVPRSLLAANRHMQWHDKQQEVFAALRQWIMRRLP